MANQNIRLRIDSTAVVRGAVCVAGDEVIVDAKMADRLVERNLATVVGEHHVEDDLDDMTVDELREYANEAGVVLTGKTKKAEIIAAIREAE